jgi:diacylglycerol kinase family enzyme
VKGVSAFIQVARPYTYFRRRPIDLVAGPSLTSGDLGAAILRRATPIDLPTVTWRALSGEPRMAGHRRVRAFGGVRDLVVRSVDERPLPVQVDGDHIGDHAEVVFSVRPGALGLLA